MSLQASDKKRIREVVKILADDDKAIKKIDGLIDLFVKIRGDQVTVSQKSTIEDKFRTMITYHISGNESVSLASVAALLREEDMEDAAKKVEALGKSPGEPAGTLSPESNTIAKSSERPPVVHNFIEIGIPLNVTVLPSAQQFGLNQSDVYQLTSERYALIISNFKYDDSESDREGGEIDGINMCHLLAGLGFSYTYKPNLSSEDLQKAIEGFKDIAEDAEASMLIVVVMSHGIGDYIQMKDGKLVHRLFDIADKFTDNKPKLFIMQACEGVLPAGTSIDDEAAIQTTPSTTMTLPYHGQPRRPLRNNVLMFTATRPGFSAYRNPSMGTFFIHCLTYAFMNHAHDTDLRTLLDYVIADMKEVQVEGTPARLPQPSIHYYGFTNKKIYFNPTAIKK